MVNLRRSIKNEHIKKVLDAIENSQPVFDSTKTRNRHNKARAILKSLNVQDPVAWIYEQDGDTCFGHPDGYRPSNSAPLYAGEQP